MQVNHLISHDKSVGRVKVCGQIKSDARWLGQKRHVEELLIGRDRREWMLSAYDSEPVAVKDHRGHIKAKMSLDPALNLDVER